MARIVAVESNVEVGAGATVGEAWLAAAETLRARGWDLSLSEVRAELAAKLRAVEDDAKSA